MRVLIVSAHYPPNFVSGGTLQPQRVAQELQRRGHDVHVYAGWIGDGRAPGEAWTETGDGLPVRWIATTPWTTWGDDRNHDNPTVAADFEQFVDAWKPDIVHLHSLQAVGGQLVTIAQRAARVVLTMHDFWWCCGRQFLVPPSMQPCSLVVDAGDCPCALDNKWLVHRNRWLREQLPAADVVLTPSAVAASVLAANGLAPDRLEVDENGMPEASISAPRRAPSHGDGVAFLYAGGSEEMKGVHVLSAACALLADTPGWRLLAYGAAPWFGDHTVDLSSVPVDLRPRFNPTELGTVLAGVDVLVLPSVMRESYSLLTREALARGIPVICAASLGPEEVVRDGRNGLIVPAADPAALADAMRRVVVDHDLLQRLRAAAQGGELRSMQDQVDGLERRYAALLDAGRPPAQDTTLRHVLFIVGSQGAPLRYRVQLPAEALALLGIQSDIRWYTDPDLRLLAEAADVVVVYRSPATPALLTTIESTRARGRPVLYDADDLIFDPDIAADIPALRILPPAEAAHWLEGVRRYRTTMEACDAYIAATDPLARHAERTVGIPAERFANGAGNVFGRLADRELRRPRRPGPPRIGYLSGTDTHDEDWAWIEDAIAGVLDDTDAELWLVGHVPSSPGLERFEDRVRRLPFRSWTTLPALLRDLDVNLAPLVLGSEFNEAKSAVKWLEAALCATPTVASATEPMVQAIEDGVDGFLARSNDEFAEAVVRLLRDGALRATIGDRARRDALLGLSSHLQGERYRALLVRAMQRVEQGNRRVPNPSWEPAVVDEPPSAQPIDPYPDVTDVDRRAQRFAPVRRLRSIAGRAGRVAQRARRRAP